MHLGLLVPWVVALVGYEVYGVGGVAYGLALAVFVLAILDELGRRHAPPKRQPSADGDLGRAGRRGVRRRRGRRRHPTPVGERARRASRAGRAGGARLRRCRVSPATTATRPVDYRFSLANERTFLAWVRTSLALLAGGIALEEIATSFLGDTARTHAGGGSRSPSASCSRRASYVRWAPGASRRCGSGGRLPHPWAMPLLATGVVAVAGALGARARVLVTASRRPGGAGPDPALATERTALAWFRTVLSCGGLAALSLRLLDRNAAVVALVLALAGRSAAAGAGRLVVAPA